MFKFDKACRQEFRTNWLLLATAFSCFLFGLAATAFSMPFLFPEVIAEFGWSRETATLLASNKYLFATFGALIVGLVIDRAGVWIVLLCVMTLAGTAMVLWIWMSSLTLYHLSGAMTGLAVGGGGMAIKVLIARSFHASQGTAMGVAMTGATVASTIIPTVITIFIGAFGWRYGFAAMSLPIWFIVIPLLVFGYFHSKKASVQFATPEANQGGQDLSLTIASTGDQGSVFARVRNYLGQKNLWVIGMAVVVSSVVDSGFTQHQVLILKDFDFAPATVVSVVTIIGMVGVGARLFCGNVLDATSNIGLAGLYLTILLTCAAAPFLSAPLILISFVLFRAVGHAVVMLDTAIMIKHTYGNIRDLGILYFLMYIFSHVGLAAGPWLMGRIFDVSGSYNLAYIIFAGLSLVAVFLALKIKPTFWLEMNQKATPL